MPIGNSTPSLLLTSTTLADDIQGPPPPPLGHPLILHIGHAGLCKAWIEHIDQLQPSYYPFWSTGLRRA